MTRFYACDNNAFDVIEHRWRKSLYAYFSKCPTCRNRDRAEDLTQETFIRIFLTKERRSARYSPKQGPFRSWMFRIAHHVHVDAHRRDKRHPEEQLRDFEIGEED